MPGLITLAGSTIEPLHRLSTQELSAQTQPSAVPTQRERVGWQTLFSCSCSPMAMLTKSCQSSLQSADAARQSPPHPLRFHPATLILFSLPPTLFLTRLFCSPSAAVSSQFSAATHKSPRLRRLSASAAPTCILNGFYSVGVCVYTENSSAPPNRIGGYYSLAA